MGRKHGDIHQEVTHGTKAFMLELRDTHRPRVAKVDTHDEISDVTEEQLKKWREMAKMRDNYYARVITALLDEIDRLKKD